MNLCGEVSGPFMAASRGCGVKQCIIYPVIDRIAFRNIVKYEIQHLGAVLPGGAHRTSDLEKGLRSGETSELVVQDINLILIPNSKCILRMVRYDYVTVLFIKWLARVP